MKTIATLIAGLFAATAFAAEPAKTEVKPAAPAATAPVAAPKVDAVTKQDKHDVAKPAKSEGAAPAKADAKAATPAATTAPAAK